MPYKLSRMKRKGFLSFLDAPRRRRRRREKLITLLFPLYEWKKSDTTWITSAKNPEGNRGVWVCLRGRKSWPPPPPTNKNSSLPRPKWFRIHRTHATVSHAGKFRVTNCRLGWKSRFVARLLLCFSDEFGGPHTCCLLSFPVSNTVREEEEGNGRIKGDRFKSRKRRGRASWWPFSLHCRRKWTEKAYFRQHKFGQEIYIYAKMCADKYGVNFIHFIAV